MKRLPAIAILALTAVAAGVGGLLLGGEPASSAPGGQPPMPVQEQNLDENGYLRVHEQGTATVGIRGTPTVKVAADEPFQRTLAISCSGFCTGSFEVPEGKRLTLRYVSAYAGDLVWVAVHADPADPGPLAGPVAPAVEAEIGIVSEEILFVAEPGTTVFVSARHVGTGTAHVHLAGTLTDA